MDAPLTRISGKSELASAIRYARSRWAAPTLGRKDWIFAGSAVGGERAAAIYTLVETAKLNGLAPKAYLRDVLGRIAEHPVNRIGELLPWSFVPCPTSPA